MALNKIRVKIGSTEVSYFLYDNRDCKYYSLCTPGTFSQDITLRVDGSNGAIWFYEGHNTSSTTPSVANGWELVTNGRKNIWEVYGVTNCPLDFSGDPDTPQNLELSGDVGENPVLSWLANTDPDLDGYKIYQKIGNGSYSFLVKVSESSTSYTDIGVIITGGYFDPEIKYKITAVDDQNLESGFSNEVYTKSNSLNRQMRGFEKELQSDHLNIIAYPNPFNPSTKICFYLHQKEHVQLKVFDIIGNEVTTLVNEIRQPGVHIERFDASTLSTGVYFYYISNGKKAKVQKIIYMK